MPLRNTILLMNLGTKKKRMRILKKVLERGFDETEQLMSILSYITRLHVRSFAVAIKTFKDMIKSNDVQIMHSLIVLINDSEEMREEFSKDPPLSLIQRDDFGNVVGIEGFFGIIVKDLKKTLNLTLKYIESDCKGSLLTNGSWTGVIGLLQRNEADLAANGLIMTIDKMNVIEFTFPIFLSKSRIFIKNPSKEEIKWTAYIDPFPFDVWVSILIFLIIFSGLTALSCKISSKWQAFQEQEVESHSAINMVFQYFGALCAQGFDCVTIDSIRLLNFTVHISGVVIMAAYSAALYGFLTLKLDDTSSRTIKGYLGKGGYTLGVMPNSADYRSLMVKLHDLTNSSVLS
ncbi:glutamate receptor-like [Copidosoma floridanum]|uniref:glutamate receptor-like n=1 Tax=Copidosoma floridanum TaxID=29053 RepID=UPI0006C94B72|nr:glutamate receptor-like [Copidosoma floridanum]